MFESIKLINPARDLSKKNIHSILKLEDLFTDIDIFEKKSYKKGDKFVLEGKFVEVSSNFSYAHVPLGLIVSGEVTVYKNDRHSKKLTVGDFVGLFETADYLFTGSNRKIGDWNLEADSDVEILYFKKDFLNSETEELSDFRNYIIETSRIDSVPQPLSSLPLLDWFASEITAGRLEDHAVILHTHILNNNVPLFRHIAHLVGVNKVYIVGKPYSTISKAHEELALSGMQMIPVNLKPGVPYSFSIKESLEVLWHGLLEDRKTKSFSNVLILDDGGDIWTSIPWNKIHDLKIAGTEQTQRGVSRIKETSLKLPPIVSVATSGIKKHIEPIFISQSIVNKFKQNSEFRDKKIGLLGTGSIGKALHVSLINDGYDCFYYDPSGVDIGEGKVSSIDELLNASDVIIGSTGIDSLRHVAFDRITGEKTLISASSSDVEFSSVMQFVENRNLDPFDDVNVSVSENLSFRILNGGFPFNFDRRSDATPDDEIVLTRCLLYLGLIQAGEILDEGKALGGFYSLDASRQKLLVERWFEEVPLKSNQFILEEVFQAIDESFDKEF